MEEGKNDYIIWNMYYDIVDIEKFKLIKNDYFVWNINYEIFFIYIYWEIEFDIFYIEVWLWLLLL